MNNNNLQQSNKSSYDLISEGEINFEEIYQFFIRNKRFIASITLLTSFIFILYAITKKRTWQGEFQIVLEQKDKNDLQDKLSNLNVPYANFRTQSIGIASPNKLITEVGILESSSVLFNVFEFVKKEKILKGYKSAKDLSFKNWRKKRLSIRLKKGTSILNLSYRDNEKDLIVPVLNKISSTYQQYSGKKRIKDLDLSIEYLNDQINLFKTKSLNSSIEAEEFGARHAIAAYMPRTSNQINQIKRVNMLPKINVEQIQFNSNSKIREIDIILNQIKTLDDKSSLALILSLSMDKDKNYTMLNLEELDKEIALSKVKYKANDQLIINLIKRRKQLVRSLIENTITRLETERLAAEAKVLSAQRPKDVVMKYKELLAKARQDESTLVQLDSEYRKILLQRAVIQSPWELITKPTLLKNPVAPSRKKIAFTGLIGGLIAGTGAAYYYERKKDFVNSSSEITRNTKLPIIAELKENETNKWDEYFDLISRGILSKNDGSIALINIGETNPIIKKEISKSLQKAINTRKLIVTEDTRESLNCDDVLLLVSEGITKNQELNEIRKKLIIQNKTISGIVLLKRIY